MDCSSIECDGDATSSEPSTFEVSLSSREQVLHYEDELFALQQSVPLGTKLEILHAVLRRSFPSISCITVVRYSERTRTLRSMEDSVGAERPLLHIQFPLDQCPALRELADKRIARVIQRSPEGALASGAHPAFGRAEYQSSYTLPLFQDSALAGYVFFSSHHASAFSADVVDRLQPYSQLVALTVSSHLAAADKLIGAVQAVRELAHLRDDETAAHQDRMGAYAWLIAAHLSDSHSLSTEFVDQLAMFAPLHDIGKIGIPDHILLKPGRLSPAEFDAMKTHTTLGGELVGRVACNFGGAGALHLAVLRNIVELHHEAMDGTGYPHGLSGAGIPIEARIVAAADVFDALTSRRPYKSAWSIDDAFTEIRRISGTRLDAACAAALTDNRRRIEEIKEEFGDG